MLLSRKVIINLRLDISILLAHQKDSRLFRVELYNCIHCYRVESIEGTATEGQDYVEINQLVTFEPNESTKTVSGKGDTQLGEDYVPRHIIRCI